MLIIAGYVVVPAEKRDSFVEAHKDLVRRARAAEGCLDVSISTDPVDPARINMQELWESEEALEAWRKVADSPVIDVPMNDEHVLKHQISSSGPPF